MRSYDTIKLSTESLEVSLQHCNINFNFRDNFRFLWAPASTDLMHKMALGAPLQGEKWLHDEKRSIFQSL